MSKPESNSFQQRIGLFDATMLVSGTMIGSGIFIVASDMARDVGSAGWLLGLWIVTGIMTLLGALSYAELASMMPRAGAICLPQGGIWSAMGLSLWMVRIFSDSMRLDCRRCCCFCQVFGSPNPQVGNGAGCRPFHPYRAKLEGGFTVALASGTFDHF